MGLDATMKRASLPYSETPNYGRGPNINDLNPGANTAPTVHVALYLDGENNVALFKLGTGSVFETVSDCIHTFTIAGHYFHLVNCCDFLHFSEFNIL